MSDSGKKKKKNVSHWTSIEEKKSPHILEWFGRFFAKLKNILSSFITNAL